MTNAHGDVPNSHANVPDNWLPHVADAPVTDLPERSVDEWEAADSAQRLIQLNEARPHVTPEQRSEPNAGYAAFCALQDERTLTRYPSLHNQNDADVSQGSAHVRTRPLNSQYGSDGNQYNPYAPHTSEEYMLQEIEAGRMDPEIMGIPRQLSDPTQAPLLRSGAASPLSHSHPDGQSSWMVPGHRTPYRQGLTGRGHPYDSSDSHEASWSRHPYAGSTSVEEFREEEGSNINSAPIPHPKTRDSPAMSKSSHYTPYPSLPSKDNPLRIQGPMTSTRDHPALSETFVVGVPLQPNSASTGRGRKRLAKPSLVVKLKTHFPQKTLQAPVSPRRNRLDAPSSSESSSAAQVTQNPRPSNLRSQGPLSSTNAKTRAGWDPQAVRRLTRRTEASQSSQRKRRRDAVSAQDVSTEGTAPTAALPQGKLQRLKLSHPC